MHIKITVVIERDDEIYLDRNAVCKNVEECLDEWHEYMTRFEKIQDEEALGEEDFIVNILIHIDGNNFFDNFIEAIEFIETQE